MNDDFIHNMLAQPLRTTVAYYATCLVACAKAVAYLARNCLASDAALQVGFADRTLGTHLPSNMVKAGKEIRSKLGRDIKGVRPLCWFLDRGNPSLLRPNLTSETIPFQRPKADQIGLTPLINVK